MNEELDEEKFKDMTRRRKKRKKKKGKKKQNKEWSRNCDNVDEEIPADGKIITIKKGIK